jgi:hypothetical protein
MHFIRHWTEPANLLNDLNTGSNNNNRYKYHIFWSSRLTTESHTFIIEKRGT